MSSTRVQLLPFIIFLFSTIQRGTCLRCYSCNSSQQIECGEIFKDEAIEVVNCASGASCQKVLCHIVGGGPELVVRGCYKASYCTDLNVCLECYRDLCNSSKSTKPTFILGILAAIACIRYYS